MPELPEVTTTVNGLQKVLPRLIFTDVWTDLSKKNPIKQFKETIKDETFFKDFKKKVVGQKILKVERRAKNILINISGGYTILIHLKMTGHLLFGEYTKEVIKNEKLIITNWKPKNTGPLNDPYNRFIHVVLTFSNGKHLAFCDSRKFGKVTIIPTHILGASSHLKNIGPEPLENSFTITKFKERFILKPNWKIKTVLMDQSIIAGIGNIYSDEMLWLSSIHPESKPSKVPPKQLLKLYIAMKEVLTKGINFGGDSMSDYRNIHGLRGDFQNHHNVYKKKGTMCMKKGCHGVIIRKVINGRSAHFCNKHQRLF
ncbi:MAG: bifunctional DNA-formamidopyrimidine glycosylase/DNA-(apurinic or apyrimidinic site) lyase [Candidatus Paceibacterota bacterium]